LASASRTVSGNSSSTATRTFFEERVRLVEVLAVRVIALVEIGHGVEAKAIQAEIQQKRRTSSIASRTSGLSY